MRPLLAFACMLSATTLAAQAVEGTVTNSVTGQPIANVGVTLSSSRGSYSASADAGGKFRFSGVREGLYAVSFAAQHFWSAVGNQGKPVGIVQGAATVRLDATMIPASKLAGCVIDGRGDPVPRATIELSLTGLSMAEFADAKGCFAMDNFPFPGDYTLAAVPPVGWKPPAPDGDRALGWARTWYPGSISAEGAAKIKIVPGRDLPDFKIRLAAVPAHTIRGAIFRIDGVPAAGATVNLGDTNVLPDRSTVADSGGVFEFPAVVDGEWRLFAEMEKDGVKLVASQAVRIAGSEVTHVQLHFSAPFTLSGRVILEATEDAPAQQPPMVSLRPHAGFASGRPGQFLAGRPDSAGAFVISGIYPGQYRADSQASNPPYYLDSIRLGEKEILGEEVELPSIAPLTILYKKNGGAVRGTVDSWLPATVLLVPRDSSLSPAGFTRRQPIDANGRFEITAIRPGDYYAVAVSSVPGMSFPMFEVDPDLIAQATRVTVRAGESTQADLKIVRSDY